MTMENQIYNYLNELNQQQRQAVEYLDGPSLVIAGAGSGKTRVLTYKIMHLLNCGFESYRILVLTFTNKAAREMKLRISNAVGEKEASKLWMGTFHSIFLRILRVHADLIGFSHNFTIYDTADTKSLIKNIIKDKALDEKVYKVSTIASIISNAKNALISPEIYLSDKDYMEADNRAKRPLTGEIFKTYCERCRLAEAMDFDDILYYMNILFRDNPDILRHYQDFFRYILVDEYQDTNFAQHLIITQLTLQNQNLCVVGDDAQSIYSFRGANITNILNLQRTYPKLKIFKLERNYRSTQNIINAAGSLIKKNTQQIPKNVYSENSVGAPISVIESYSDIEESALIANSISRSKLTEHDSFDDYAILYRTNAQSRVIEEALRKRNIPYRIYGGLSFYQRKEIKEAICYFRLAINPNDDEALRKVINFPARGIGETTIKKIQASAIDNHVSMWQIIENHVRYSLSINSGTAKKLALFVELVNQFKKELSDGCNAFELGQIILNTSGLLSIYVHDNTPESISKRENLQELLSGLQEFIVSKIESGDNDTSMQAFLSEISLATDQDQDDNNEPRVTLMTIHAAKGLEFSNIYIVGVEEELFPSSMSYDSIQEIEEERRLMYVAITRAKKLCTITYANSRYRNGETKITRPSRFISDIESKYLKMHTSKTIPPSESYQYQQFINPLKKYQSQFASQPQQSMIKRQQQYQTNSSALEGTSLRRVSDIKPSQNNGMNVNQIETGMKISHSRFGEGIITHIDDSVGDTIILVNFKNVGEKKLLLKFAKFDIIK